MSEPTPSGTKTPAQRNAEHLWFRQVAQVLNDQGIDKRVVLEKLATRGIDMMWTDVSFKADVYKPILQKVAGVESTEQESTKDPNIVYMGLSKWFAQEMGVTLPPFPDRFGEMT